MDKNLEKIFDFMVRLARKAGKIQMQYYGQIRSGDMDFTDPANLRTKADKEIGELVQEEISKKYPSFNVYSEETEGKVMGHKMTFVIDEIDGTNPFTYGFNDFFSFCIGLCQGKTPILGVIFAPKRKEMYVGGPDGAFCNGKPIHVNRQDNLHRVWMGIDPGKFNRTGYIPYIQRALEEDGIAGLLQHGCASIPLCLVAAGKLDAYLATSLNAEDMAAAVAILRPAGAKVTNFKEDWQLGDSSILAANPILHEKLCDFFGMK